MKLDTKKKLAAKTLNVGKDRIMFVRSRLSEIKEAITRQDVKELEKDGAIKIKEIKGTKKNVARKRRRRAGKIKVRVKTRKKDYIIMVRKLRVYVADKKDKGLLSSEEIKDIRKKIRNKFFKSKNSLKAYIGGLKKR